MSRRLLNLTLMVLLGPLLVTFAYEGVRFAFSVFTLEATQWFLLGAALTPLPYALLRKKNIAFIEHLLHELEHAAVAFLFSFELPSRMEIDPEKGSKVQTPARGGCLTTLAPYYLPSLTIPFLLIKTLAFFIWDLTSPSVVAIALDLLIGTTLGFHVASAIRELARGQDDIKKEGWLPSFGGLLFINMIVLILSIAVVTGNYAEVGTCFETAAGSTVDTYKAVYEYIQTDVLPAVGNLVDWVREEFCDGATPTPGP
jgi:hypothetical protein